MILSGLEEDDEWALAMDPHIEAIDAEFKAVTEWLLSQNAEPTHPADSR